MTTLQFRAPGAWLVAAVAIATLPASWYWWSHERAAAERARLAREGQAALVPVHERGAARIRQWQAVRERVVAGQAQLAQRGDTPGEWEQRSVTVEGQRMSRAEAQQYLESLMTTGNSLLVPSTIHLKAAKQGESVFAAHEGLDQPEALLVTIRADFYVRQAR